MPSFRGSESGSVPVFPHPRKKRVFLRFLLLLIALLLALIVGFFGHMYYESHPAPLPAVLQALQNGIEEIVPVGRGGIVSVSHVEEIIKPASELITTRYYYTDADIFEDYKQVLGRRLPFTTNKTVFTYEGTVGLGFDFSEITVEIDSDQRMITLTLPAVHVVSNEINADSFRYFDVSNSVFNQTEMGDITDLVAVLKGKTAERVMKDTDLLDQAKNNAEQVLLGFLHASEFTENYTVSFR